MSSHPVRELANTIQKALIFNRGAPVSPEDILQGTEEEEAGGAAGTGVADEMMRKWARSRLKRGGEDHAFDACMDRFAGILIG